MASGITYTKKRAREEFGLTAFPLLDETPDGGGGGGSGGGEDTAVEEEGAGAAAPAKRRKLTQEYVHALALRTYRVRSLDDARAEGAKKLARLAAAAAARAVTAAPCARCGAAGTSKLTDGSGACIACAPCADCSAPVGTTVYEEGFGAAELRRVCASCHAAPHYERMWLSDALKTYKLTAEDLTGAGVRMFALPSRRHGIKTLVYRTEVTAVAASPAVVARRHAPPDAATLEARAEAAEAAELAVREKAAVRRRRAAVAAACAQRGLELDEHLLSHPAAAVVSEYLARSPFERAAAPSGRSSSRLAAKTAAAPPDAHVVQQLVPPPSRADVDAALDALQRVVLDRRTRLAALLGALRAHAGGDDITLRVADAWPLASFAPTHAGAFAHPQLAAHVLDGTPLAPFLLLQLAGDHAAARPGRERCLRRLCDAAAALRVALPAGMVAAAHAALSELAPTRGAFADALFVHALDDPSAQLLSTANRVSWSIVLRRNGGTQRFSHTMTSGRLCELLCGAAPVDTELLAACRVASPVASWVTWTASTHRFVSTPRFQAAVVAALWFLRRTCPALPAPIVELIVSKMAHDAQVPPLPQPVAPDAAGRAGAARGLCACGQAAAAACSMQLCGTCCAGADAGPRCVRHKQR